MIFKNPLVLILIPILIVLVLWRYKKNISPSIIFSTETLLSGFKTSMKITIYRKMIYLRIVIICLMLIALSRPQSVTEELSVDSEGIEIVIAVDISTSMLAEDFESGGKRKNRLEAVKEVVRSFIKERTGDRIGIVVFASKSYTLSPMTLDSSWLLDNLERAKIGMIEDGTAVGLGLATALQRLQGSAKDKKSKGKVVILLTDGMNNAGNISPLTAAEAAKALGVKVYTIGAGSKGPVPFPVTNDFGIVGYRNVIIDIDEATLETIAKRTGGRYFRATDMDSLINIYNEIDKLEKVTFEEKHYYMYRELFTYFLIAGLLLLIVEVAMKTTVLRRIP
ncbi:MAG: VWA domain-containing protein [Candidatus Magnetoovum sp. WYHC-5]|nr:VWA domain-containing protein [Candidatus Magnetoovum sp. WYHC-5]